MALRRRTAAAKPYASGNGWLARGWAKISSLSPFESPRCNAAFHSTLAHQKRSFVGESGMECGVVSGAQAQAKFVFLKSALKFRTGLPVSLF